MKKVLLFSLLILIGMSAFGATASQSVDFGYTAFNFFESPYRVNTSMVGVTYRYISYPKDIGFYYGFDGTSAFPLFRTVKNDDYISTGPAKYVHGLVLSMPFGYRWAGKEKPVGFFLGGGPTVQFFNGFYTQSIIGLGLISELGYETNLTEGSQFHFVFQFGWSPGVFGVETGYFSGQGFITALRCGITWRRLKADK